MKSVEGMKQVSEVSWEIPPSFKSGMKVPARIYASKTLLEGMDSGVFDQVTNVACLPGIVKCAYAMADAHWGYGFPIGGVAAFDTEKGVISPAAWASTSTAACVSSGPTSGRQKCNRRYASSST